MNEPAATISQLAAAAEALNKVTGADKQVKEILTKISELTTRVKA